MSIFASLAPVALRTEARSELLKAAALVPIGGLLTSTLLTLVFVPAMYTLFDDAQERVKRLFRRGPRALPAPAPRLGSAANPPAIAGGADGHAE